MAVGAAPAGICRLARFGLTTTNAVRLAAFYERACGFHRLATERLSGAKFESLMGVAGGALSIKLGVGNEVIELVEFNRPGRPYQQESSAADIIFQHFAIVVANIDEAYQRLSAVAGWSPISNGGPQRLPATSGGVTAFKFRDLDGHPLELLAFATGRAPPCWVGGSGSEVYLGIDHSAISVSDSSRSISFYEGLGLRIAARSRNSGPEQERLDGIREPRLEVIALAPREATPHIELLCYQWAEHRRVLSLSSNDIAASRLVLEASRDPATTESIDAYPLLDPDGHHLLIVPAAK